ncbi:unnamed protein product [Adineta ricciae]|uniref:G-protein coupled receptors family 1 profile domain-containing protein n=1 Tax=Adineta ricciae TaxID=249248 RepID=A0A814HA16_ADIRI|nr:unnamed protein product [Adineta ricciae]
MMVWYNSELVETLTSSTIKIHLLLSIVIFMFGFIGNVLNILILAQRTLRSIPCIYFFLISSIANLISILFGLIPRIISTWQLDFTATQDIPCKIRAFVLFTTRTVALWLITLATIDRWLISCNVSFCRQLSSLKHARIGSLVITIISCLMYTQMFFCYKANLTNTPLKCYGRTRLCRSLTDITYASFTVLSPLILMILFGLLTISNIRKSQHFAEPHRVVSVRYLKNERTLLFKQRKQRWKKLDRYLRRILFLQVILFIFLTLPQTIHKIYFTSSSLQQKSSIEYKFDALLYRFELLLPFIESSLPFYICILTGGRIFRNALRRLFRC